MIDKRSFLERMVIVSLLVIMVIQILPVSLLGQELEIDPDDSTLSVETKAPEPDDDDLNVDSGAEEQQSEVPDRPEATSPQKIQKIKALPDKAILEKFELEYSEETKAENSRSEDEEPEFAAGRSIAFDTKFEISSPDPLTEEEQFTRLGIQPENFSQYELVEVPARLGKTKLELWVPADLVKDKPEVPESKADPGFELLADKPTVELVKLTGKGLSKKTDLFETEGRENELHSFWQITYPLKDLEANLDQEPREYTIRTTFKVDQDKLKDFCKLFKKLSKADADLDKRDALLDKSCLYEADKDTLGSLLLADLYDKESGKSFFDHPDEYLPALDLYILKEEVPDEESSTQESKKVVEESKAATDKTAEESKREEESEPEQVEETATSVPQGLKGLTRMVRSADQPRSTTRFGELKLILPPEQIQRDADPKKEGNQTFNGDGKVVTFVLPITANAGDVKNMKVELKIPTQYVQDKPIANNSSTGQGAVLKSTPKVEKIMENGQEFWSVTYELLDYSAQDTQGQGITIAVPTTFKTRDTLTPDVTIPVKARLIDGDTGKIEKESEIFQAEFINAPLHAKKEATSNGSVSTETTTMIGDGYYSDVAPGDPTLAGNIQGENLTRIRGGSTDPQDKTKLTTDLNKLSIAAFEITVDQGRAGSITNGGYREVATYKLVEHIPRGAKLANIPENSGWKYDASLDAYVMEVEIDPSLGDYSKRQDITRKIYLQFPGMKIDRYYVNRVEVEAVPRDSKPGEQTRKTETRSTFVLEKNHAESSSDALLAAPNQDYILDRRSEREAGKAKHMVLRSSGSLPADVSEIKNLVIRESLNKDLPPGVSVGQIEHFTKFSGPLTTEKISGFYTGTYTLKYVTADGQEGVLAAGIGADEQRTIDLPTEVNGSPIVATIWSADEGGVLKVRDASGNPTLSGGERLYKITTTALDPSRNLTDGRYNKGELTKYSSTTKLSYTANEQNFQSSNTGRYVRLNVIPSGIINMGKYVVDVNDPSETYDNTPIFDKDTRPYVEFFLDSSYRSGAQITSKYRLNEGDLDFDRLKDGDIIEFNKVVDVLPRYLEYVPGSAYLADGTKGLFKGQEAATRVVVDPSDTRKTTTVNKPSIEPQIVPNYKGSGKTALIWDMNTLEKGKTKPFSPYYGNGLFQLKFLTKIRPDAPNGIIRWDENNPFGKYSNGAYLDWSNKDEWQVNKTGWTDDYDVDDNGITNESAEIGLTSVSVTGNSTLVAVKEVKGHLDKEFSLDPGVAHMEKTGTVTYAVTARNNAAYAMPGVTILDLLPKANDIHFADNTSRNSAFRLKLKSPVQGKSTVPVAQPGQSVVGHDYEYQKFDIYYTTKEYAGMTQAAYLAGNWWTKDFTPDAVAIKMVPKDPNYKLPAGKEARFEFDLEIPQSEYRKVKTGDMGVNSIGCRADGKPLFESNDAKVKIVDYELKGRTFLDTDGDGVYDGAKDKVLAGQIVEVVDETGNPVLNPGTNEPYRATTDANGQYSLTIVKNGKYKIRVANPTYRGAKLVPTKLAAGNPEGNTLGKNSISQDAKIIDPFHSPAFMSAGFSYPLTELTVKKIAGNKDKPLEGAEFRVVSDYKENGSPVYDKTLATGSEFKFTDLEPGKYTLTETKGVAGYLEEKSAIKFEVVDRTTDPAQPNVIIQFPETDAYIEYDEANKALYVNNRPLAKVVLKKEDGKTNQALAGAVFELTSSDPGFAARTLTIPASGALTIDMLPAATYTLTETQAPDTSYSKLAKPIIFQVSETELSKTDVRINIQLAPTSDPAGTYRKPFATEEHNGLITIKNYPKTTLAVNKVDPNGKPLEGAEFKLVSKDVDGTGQPIYSQTGPANTGTNKNQISFEQVDAGSYYLIETKAPAGYQGLGEDNKICLSVLSKGDGTYTCLLDNQGNSAKVKTLVSVDPATGQVTVKNKKSLTLEVDKYRYDPGYGEAHYQEIPDKYAHFRIYSEKKNAQGKPLVDETWDGQTNTRIERSQNAYTLKDLEPGIYYIEEKQAPEDFLPLGDFIKGTDKAVKIELSEDAQGFSRIKILSPMPYADFYSDVIAPEDPNYAKAGKIPLLEVSENPGFKMDRLNITNMPVPKVYEKDDLFEVKKKVTGKAGNVMDGFKFTIRIDKPVYMKNHPNYQGGKWDKYKLGDQEYTYGEDHVFYLKHGESLKLSNFMLWSNLYLKEVDSKGHTTKVTITEWEEDMDWDLNRKGFINEDTKTLTDTTETGPIWLNDHSVYPPKYGGWYGRAKYLVEFTNQKLSNPQVGFYQNNRPLLMTMALISSFLVTTYVLVRKKRCRFGLKGDAEGTRKE